MKRRMVLTILSALMMAAIAMPNAQAASAHMDEVSIFATNPGGTISLTAYNINAPNEAELQYSTGGVFETVTEAPIVINDSWSQIFFQLALPGESAVKAGNLTFSGQQSDPFYTNVVINWDLEGYNFSLVAGNSGTLVANAPIPASALLLSTGLIGMIVFRRRTTL